MMMPRLLRRMSIAPAVLLLASITITTLPLWLIAAALIAPRLPGRLRALRILSFVIVIIVIEALAVIVLTALWIAAGLRAPGRSPRSRALHYALMRWYLAVLFWSARRVFSLDFIVDASEARTTVLDVDAALHEGVSIDPVVVRRSIAASLRRRLRRLRRLRRPQRHPVSSGRFRTTDEDRRAPLLVFSRHAGPGDSLLLVHALLQQQLRPHIVLRDVLQWAPALDIALNRLPNLFIRRAAPLAGARSQRGRSGDDGPAVQREGVAMLAAGLGPGDALVLFPEGRNFTARRRLTSIARLEERGEHAAAELAREMRHVLMPRVGGASAAVAAAQHADVIFVAHTGLEDLSSFVDLWRGTPMDASIKVKLWRVPADEVPADDRSAARWLLDWWSRIDAWILEHHGRAALPDAAVTALEHRADHEEDDHRSAQG